MAACGPAGQPYHAGPSRPGPASPTRPTAPRPADWAAYRLVPAKVSAIPPDLLRQLRQAAGDDFALASAGEDFQAGCTSGFKLPTRRLCLLATTGSKWLLAYEHGGIALRFHLISCVLEDGRATAIRNCGLGSRPTTLAELWAEGVDCPTSLGGKFDDL